MVEKGRPGTEKHIRYATTAATVPAAFEFVMAHLDEFGGEPRVEIVPKWFCPAGWSPGDKWSLQFEVTVSGLVQT